MSNGEVLRAAALRIREQVREARADMDNQLRGGNERGAMASEVVLQALKIINGGEV